MRHALPIGLLAILLVPPAAHAAVDLTGTYAVVVSAEIIGTQTGTFTFEQTGTALSLVYDVENPTFGRLTGSLVGTVDPDAGTFDFPLPDTPVPSPFPFPIFPPCTGNGIRGTASPDGETIAGLWVQAVPRPSPAMGCVNAEGPFRGARHPGVCGDGVIDVLEECDDGNTAAGDCCSPACVFEEFGTPCDDGDACTADDRCDGAGTCSFRGPLACGPCERCVVASGCVPGPEPQCQAIDGRARLTLDLSAKLLAFTARRASPVDVGIPATIGDYGLCVFAAAGSGWSPVFSAHVPGDGICQGRRCWEDIRRGSRYWDPAGTFDGMLLVTLRSGGRNAAISVRGRGPNLPDGLFLPGMTTARVQLRDTFGRDGACYASDFANVVLRSPVLLQAKK